MISQLNRSEDKDDLDVSLRKEHENTPTPPTTHMVNLSVKQSVVPAMLKVGAVCPIFKTDKHNYRPINISPLVSKLIEK